MKNWFVLDVESIGLHGQGFAVGWVVVSPEGIELDSGLLSCQPHLAKGDEDGHQWVRANVPTLPITHSAPWLVRAAFWANWMRWNSTSMMTAECGWPVEARFLAMCIQDDPTRTPDGPYPMHDITTLLWADRLRSGLPDDSIQDRDRLPSELPSHNPLNDARQSARLLVEAIKRLREDPR